MAFRNILLPESPERFTSVFGMGTGPSPQLWPPTPELPPLHQIIKHSRRLLLTRGSTFCEVAIIGVGMTPVTAGSDKSLRELFVEAATEAIEDAGVDKLDSMYVGNMMSGYLHRQEHLGALMATAIGRQSIPACKVEGACASEGVAQSIGGIGTTVAVHVLKRRA